VGKHYTTRSAPECGKIDPNHNPDHIHNPNCYMNRETHPNPITHSHVRECCNNEASQWKRPKLDSSPRQNPLTDLHQNWQTWLRHGWHPTQKIL